MTGSMRSTTTVAAGAAVASKESTEEGIAVAAARGEKVGGVEAIAVTVEAMVFGEAVAEEASEVAAVDVMLLRSERW